MTSPRTRLAAVAAAMAGLMIAGAGPALADKPDRPGLVRWSPDSELLWRLRADLSAGPVTTSFRYGPSGNSSPFLTGDWDGNGTRTPGVVRVSGTSWVWSLRNSASAGPADIHPFAYGSAQLDVPVVGDWDGDGKDTVGLVRRPVSEVDTPTWLLRNTNTAGPAGSRFRYGLPSFGTAGYTLVVGDWDGNGTDTPGQVLRPREGTDQLTWQLRDSNSAGPANRTFRFGVRDDVPAVGNWDGAGADGIGIIRNEQWTWRWRLRQTPDAGGTQYSFLFGSTDDAPILWG